MSHDHASDASTSIVQGTGTLGLEKWLELAQDGVVAWEIGGRVGGVEDQQANGISGIRLGLGVLISQLVDKKLEEGCSEWSDAGTHVSCAFGNDTDSCRSLVVGRRRCELGDCLLVDLENLAKL